MIQKFHDAAERAPSGGWSYFYDPSDGATMFKKSSPDEVIDEVVKYRRNNGQPHDRATIEAEIWRYYCSRHPERCGGEAKSNVVPFLPRDLKPADFGPPIWRFLNLAAVRFDHIGPERFFQILASILPMMGCPECQAHWARIISDNPPEVASAKEACRWVNKVHNLVNAITGAAQYSYEAGVTEFGFPLP